MQHGSPFRGSRVLFLGRYNLNVPARSDAGGASKGVIAMLEKALIDLAALATIAQFVLDLWRGRKTRPEDANDKKNGQ